MTDPTRHPQLCVGAIAVHDGELLLIRRAQPPAVGQWSVPGGRLEHGELLIEAVVRELREETGLEGVCGPLIGWVERFDGDDHYVIMDFEVTVLERGEPRQGDDTDAAEWVALADVSDVDLVEGLMEFLHEHGVIDTIT